MDADMDKSGSVKIFAIEVQFALDGKREPAELFAGRTEGRILRSYEV